MGALRLAQEPRGRAARRASTAARRRGCAPRCCRSCSAATSTTACSTRCACCTGRSASTRPSAAPAGPSAPTTSSSRAAASARSSSPCSCCRWCAAASTPSCARGPTLQALQRVAAAGLMPQATADALARAYEFLRRVEHRIQYLDDQQTHVLMGCDDDLGWIARTMGFADCCPFLHELDAHRELVAQEFDTLLGGAGGECKGCNGPEGRAGVRARPRSRAGAAAAAAARTRGRLARNPRVLALRDDARARLSRLVARTGAVAGGRARQRGSRAAHGRLDRAAAAARKLPGAAAGAPRRARAAAAPAGRGALAGALPAAAPGRDRRTGQRPAAVGALLRRPISSANWSSAGARCRSPARTTTRRCSTCCAAPTTPKCSARWRATSKAC